MVSLLFYRIGVFLSSVIGVDNWSVSLKELVESGNHKKDILPLNAFF